MTSPTYNVVSSHLLMENHISAGVLDSAEGFTAFQTPAGNLILLSIGSDAIFRASVEAAGSQTGWKVTDVSTLLASQYPVGTTLSAGYFASSDSGPDRDLSILLSITAISSGSGSSVDEVWLLTGPPTTDASVWLQNGSITFTKLAYDATPSTPVQSITPDTLKVTGLYKETGLLPTDPTLSIATVADPDAPGELRCFLLNPNASAGTNVWSYYPQEQDIGIGGLCIAPGRIKSDYYSWGLYKLYQLDGTPSLTYLPTYGAFGPPDATVFTVPDGASAIATLAYQPEGATSSYTDLFVAADGYIGYFSYDQGRPHEAVSLITSSLIIGVTQLHVVTCGDQALIWGLNGAGQLFYTAAPMTERATPSAWKSPLPLLVNVSGIAPVTSNLNYAIDLFAVAPLGSTTATGNSAIGNGLLRLSRNASTGAWLNSVHPMPSTTDCITLKTYTTHCLIEDSNNIPQPLMALKGTASADCTLIINGSAEFVYAGETFDITTDSSGYVDLIHAVSSLATPSFTLTVAGGETFDINPSGQVTKTLSNITSSDLTNATYVDANGNTQNLVAASTSAEAVSGVTQSLQTISSHLPKLPTAATFNAMVKQGEIMSQDNDLFSDLGDIVQWIVNVVEDVVEITFKVVDDVIHFVVTIAEDVFTAVINTVEDALHAITALFKWIGAEVEAVFRWLAFLFNWSDFITVKNMLKDIVNQAFTSLISMEAQLKAAGDAWFSNVKANILPNLTKTKMAKPSDQPIQQAWSSQQPPPPPVGPHQVDLRTDPRVGWLKSRMTADPTTTKDLAAGNNTTSSDPILDAINTLMKDMGDAFAAAFKDIEALVEGKVSALEFFDAILAAAEVLGLDALQAVFDVFVSALGTMLSVIQEGLNMPLDIPILSPLYRLATGSELTLLDLACFIGSIGLNIIYKIANDESPVAILPQVVSPATVAEDIATMLSTTAPLAPMGDGNVYPVRPSGSMAGIFLILEGLTLPINTYYRYKRRLGAANVFYAISMTWRVIRACMNYGRARATGETYIALITYEFLGTICCYGLIISNLMVYGVESPSMTVICFADGAFSLTEAIWQDIVLVLKRECVLSIVCDSIYNSARIMEVVGVISGNPYQTCFWSALCLITSITGGVAQIGGDN
ncbi:hypothetical protein FBEOM_13929 [Fusarium beomiforme]|uniref:Uncharacterized protein n=1 Tax=Fusarium beomiforme TaxID=44412 RepID=A0A9P5DRM9_9HYPO|nr:hypothetical protein FBEOM_13929 [Fusarium beomiforme]